VIFASSTGSRCLAACDFGRHPWQETQRDMLMAVSHLLLYVAKRNLAANEAHFGTVAVT